MSEKLKLYVDWDGVIGNTIKTICTLYAEDFCEYDEYRPVDWSEINSWDFDELEATTREYINNYFNQPRFFEKVEWMPWAKEMLEKLNGVCQITIVSLGDKPNLKLKKKWIDKNLPFCKFVGLDFKEHSDKSSVNMAGGVFIDDSISNLKRSNAAINVCFGDEYSWNEEWNGLRCYNWCDVWKMFKENYKKEDMNGV